MLRIPNTNVVFIHIPKTAGQAVRDAFGIKLSGRSSHSMQTEEDKKWMTGNFIRFCVVRHPMTRFISAYTYNVHHAESKPTGIRKVIIENELNRDINRFVEYFYGDERPQIAEFDHFKRQTYFCRVGKPQIILRQENLSRDIQIIARLIPDHFLGLMKRNVASDRNDDQTVITELSDASVELVRRYYRQDFVSLGYSDTQSDSAQP